MRGKNKLEIDSCVIAEIERLKEDKGNHRLYLANFQLTDDEVKTIFNIINERYPELNNQIIKISLSKNQLNQSPDVVQFR